MIVRDLSNLLKLPKGATRATIKLDASTPHKININLDMLVIDDNGIIANHYENLKYDIVDNIPYNLNKIEVIK